MSYRRISPQGSPLRQRMIEDMTLLGFTAGIQQGYLRAVRDFTVFRPLCGSGGGGGPAALPAAQAIGGGLGDLNRGGH